MELTRGWAAGLAAPNGGEWPEETFSDDLPAETASGGRKPAGVPAASPGSAPAPAATSDWGSKGDTDTAGPQSSAGTGADVAGSQTAYFGFSDSIPGNTGTPYSLAIGSSVTGVINPETDQDWFRVTLNAGQTYTFVLSGSGPTWLHDPFLRVFDSGSVLVASNDDFAVSPSFSRITYTPSASGTYYLAAGAFQAGGYDDVGQYTLSAVSGTQLPNYTYDQIADTLLYGYHDWESDFGEVGLLRWGTTNITYNIAGLTGPGQTLALAAMAAWSDVSNLTFTSVASGAMITFDDNQANAFANYNFSGTTLTLATVNVGTDWLALNGSAIDSYSFQTYIHEIGHVIGLGHGGLYNFSETYSPSYNIDNHYRNDSWALSVMSYMDQVEDGLGSHRFVMTTMMADIIAIQALYGARATRTGDTTYGHNSNAGSIFSFNSYVTAPALTIYDSGGNDTLDCSGYSATQTINIASGAYSSIGGLTNNIAISGNTVIENAFGGSGSDTIHGTTGANTLRGNAGIDTLWGKDGDDILNGGSSNDVLHGDGGWDIAAYSVSSSAATWIRNADGTWTVTAGADGTDTVWDTEVMRFTDRDVLMRAYVGDFNGDARSDMLFRSASTGQVVESQLNGFTITASGTVSSSVATTSFNWQIAAIGDFNGDARSDILWRNRATGQVWEEQLNGLTIIGSGTVATVGLEWELAAVGDFNGDSRSDILWRHVTTGQVWQYQLNGLATIGSGAVTTLGHDWRIEGAGDFNGDGRSDILWRNAITGQVWEYQLNGTSVINAALVGTLGLDWQIEGIGDFNLDGRSDILWRNLTNGQVWEYQMDGGTTLFAGMVATVGLEWQVEGVGDFNGDGRSDILWRNINTGQIFEYQLSGTGIIASGPVSTVNLDLQVAGTDGLGHADIIWRNVNSGQVRDFQMNGTTIVSNTVVATVAAPFQIAGRGDFNGDGHSDILWRNTSTGQVWEYQLNNATVVNVASVGTVGLDWQIAGTGDFNGDGHSDILWRNVNSGQVFEYQLNGAAITHTGSVATVGLEWQILGVGDFNGDRHADILWRNSNTGQVLEYLMNGTAIMSSANVGNTAAVWAVEGIGDFNADGRSDILWRNTSTGQVWEYLMNGGAIIGGGAVTTVGLEWQIEGVGDFNADGRSDILWRNVNTSQVVEYLMNGTTILSSGSLAATVPQDWQVFL